MVRFDKFSGDHSPEINLMPLVDIIFLLLIFFILSANLKEKGMDIHLPEAQSSRTIHSNGWVVGVKEDRSLYLNDLPVSWKDFGISLERAGAGAGRPEIIIVKSAGSVPFKYFVKISDICHKAGFTNIVIATKGVSANDKQRK